jgi:hypothetical protein
LLVAVVIKSVTHMSLKAAASAAKTLPLFAIVSTPPLLFQHRLDLL